MTCMLRRKSKFDIETDVASVELRAEALAKLRTARACLVRPSQIAAELRTLRAGVEVETAAALAMLKASSHSPQG